MDYEIAFQEFCEEVCTHKDNRDVEPLRWQALDPCNNCPAESFSDHLEENTDNNKNGM